MKYLILIATALTIAGCADYTDKTSPCVGADKSNTVSRSSFNSLSFAAPEVSRNAAADDCTYRPIGS